MKKTLFPVYLLSACLFLISFSSCKPKNNEKQTASVDSNLNLEELSISDLQNGYKQGKYTVTAVVQGYLDRINELDKNGPQLNSVIEINPDALQIAAELDKELASGKSRGALHGVPILLNGSIATINTRYRRSH